MDSEIEIDTAARPGESNGQRLARINAQRKAKGLPVGRPKGSVNRFTAMIRDGIAATYERMGGDEGFQQWATKNPDKFYTQLMKLVPKEPEAGIKGAAVNVTINTGEALRPVIIEHSEFDADDDFRDLLGDDA